MTKDTDSLDARMTVPLRTVVGDVDLAVDVVDETLRPGALDLPVRWAHVCELRDPAPYLLGDELLLTSGVNLPTGAAEVDRYVRGLRASGIAALGFGITPPMSAVLPDALRRACVRHGLPLLVVPQRTPFLAVSRAVAVALAEAGRRELRRIADAREALTRAATDGLDELARRLADRLAGWVRLLDADDRVVTEHRVPAPPPPELGGLLAHLRAGSGVRSASTELADGSHVVAQPAYPQATSEFLVIAGRGEPFGGAERAILAVGAALLGLVGRGGSGSGDLAASATGLLLASAGPGEAAAALLGDGPYRVLAGTPYRRGPGVVEAGYHWLRARLGTPLIQVTEGPAFTAVVSSRWDTARLDGLRADGWLAVAGGLVPAERLPGALAEVKALRERAVALGRPVLGGASGLASVIEPTAAAGYAARMLAPLHSLDASRGGELLDTLRAWLAHHGGWDRTAAALGVHRNSVRHRIGQAERALDMDLSDPETRMELWFALRWSR
ncbi:PucR family transcriptional regulator [Pseudonocardia acaciae]|uniref:PucR family transcriptional regulator n=1 Tax=Pseudonocardia acaciae TaxID=551276 RepID=UPI00048B154D|nr:PucR family transcriptional regulator [Pseudonocardia acaciae]